MLNALRVSLLSLAVPALLALPVITPPAGAAPKPVKPGLVALAVPDSGRGVPAVVERLSDGPTSAYSMVAVSWEGAADLPVTAHVRARRAGKWDEWVTLETAAGDGDATSRSVRGATAPIWLDVVDGVQVKVDDKGIRPRDLRVDLIDPGKSAADAAVTRTGLPASVAGADDGRPTIVSRAAWGADESIRGTCSTSTSTKATFIHHTAGSNSYTQAGAAAQIRADYAYHVRSLGWCDLGYSFVVDKFGTIYEGRGGGVDGTTLGAHAGGFNRETIGIAALGNFDVVQPPAAMVNSLGQIAGWKLGRFGRNPQGTVVLTAAGGGGTTARYADGEQVTLPVVPGHRQVGQTACPGQYLWAQMATIRAVASAKARVTPPKAIPADLQKLTNAMYVDFLGRPADPGGLSTWGGALYVGRVSPQQLALTLHRSPEGTARVVTTLYRSVLRRDPDSGGISTWGGLLTNDPTQVVAVQAMLYASPEYYATRAASNDQTWVRNLYLDVLRREPDPVGLKDWTMRTQRDGRASVAGTFLQSWESAQFRTNALYRTLLARTADPSGLQSWPPLILANGDMALASHLAASLEYYNRALTR